MQYVEREMKNDSRVKNATLFAGAREIDESIGELTLQQFHARFRLPVTRRMAQRRRSARPPKPVPAPAPPPAASADGAAVMEFVVRTLEANPGITNADLFAGAREIDPSVAALSPRQFHAKYRLQVKARLARAAAPKPKAAAPKPRAAAPKPKASSKPAARPATEPAPAEAPPPGDPVAVRRVLLDLAKELASAGTQAETIRVMARLDDYVADIMKAARG